MKLKNIQRQQAEKKVSNWLRMFYKKSETEGRVFAWGSPAFKKGYENLRRRLVANFIKRNNL